MGKRWGIANPPSIKGVVIWHKALQAEGTIPSISPAATLQPLETRCIGPIDYNPALTTHALTGELLQHILLTQRPAMAC